MQPHDIVATLSNAMDVGEPSNFDRIVEIVGGDLTKLRDILTSTSVNDEDTADTIRKVYAQCGYVLDPHSAVGYRALADELANNHDQRGIVLETAHPAKFDAVEGILGNYGVAPDAIKLLEGKGTQKIEIDTDYSQLRDIIVSKL